MSLIFVLSILYHVHRIMEWKKNLHISSIENNYLFQWKMHSVIKVPVVRSDLIYTHTHTLSRHLCPAHLYAYVHVYQCITNTQYGHCKLEKKSKAAIWNNGNDKTNLPTIIYCHFICIFNADITTFRILMSNVLLLTISSYCPRKTNLSANIANIYYGARKNQCLRPIQQFFHSFAFSLFCSLLYLYASLGVNCTLFME